MNEQEAVQQSSNADGNILSIGSRNSILSIGSVDSVLSIGRTGSILSFTSIGSICARFGLFRADLTR